MIGRLRKYWEVAKINFANRIVYPIDILSEAGLLIFIFSILYFLHRTTAAATPLGSVEGLSLVQTMWIIFFANVFSEIRSRGVVKILCNEILSGQIAYQLNRPYSYSVFHFAQYVGMRLPSILLAGPISGLFLYYIVGIPSFSIKFLLLGSVMLCVGMVMSFLMQLCVGLCSFWIGDVRPLWWIYVQVMMISGGAVVPLAFFPAAVKKIILVLPFSNVVYGAARIMVGCGQADLVFYLGLQIFWVVVMFILAKILFRIGVKNVVISGG